jgi:Spy/CpxP family protein refolding chaperone
MRSVPTSRFFVADLERTIEPDEKQREAVSKILKTRSEQISAIMERHLQEVGAIIDSTETDLAPLLHKEQQQRLRERLQRGRMERPRMMLPEMMPPPHWEERMKEHLNLNEDQVKKIQRLSEASRKEIARLIETRRDSPEAVRDSIRVLILKLDTEIKSLLTPDQQKKFEELRKGPFGFGPGEFPPPKRLEE